MFPYLKFIFVGYIWQILSNLFSSVIQFSSLSNDEIRKLYTSELGWVWDCCWCRCVCVCHRHLIYGHTNFHINKHIENNTNAFFSLNLFGSFEHTCLLPTFFFAFSVFFLFNLRLSLSFASNTNCVDANSIIWPHHKIDSNRIIPKHFLILSLSPTDCIQRLIFWNSTKLKNTNLMYTKSYLKFKSKEFNTQYTFVRWNLFKPQQQQPQPTTTKTTRRRKLNNIKIWKLMAYSVKSAWIWYTMHEHTYTHTHKSFFVHKIKEKKTKYVVHCSIMKREME